MFRRFHKERQPQIKPPASSSNQAEASEAQGETSTTVASGAQGETSTTVNTLATETDDESFGLKLLVPGEDPFVE